MDTKPQRNRERLRKRLRQENEKEKEKKNRRQGDTNLLDKNKKAEMQKMHRHKTTMKGYTIPEKRCRIKKKRHKMTKVRPQRGDSVHLYAAFSVVETFHH